MGGRAHPKLHTVPASGGRRRCVALCHAFGQSSAGGSRKLPRCGYTYERMAQPRTELPLSIRFSSTPSTAGAATRSGWRPGVEPGHGEPPEVH